MSKYILHGGNAREDNADNNSFFKEMSAGLTGKINILLIYFARPNEEISELEEQDKARFLKDADNKNLDFEVANLEKLNLQIKLADVIYLRGGNTTILKKKLSMSSNLETRLKDKVIGGSSAGAYALSRFFWENDTKEFMEGLGILNIKVFCHYSPELNDKRDQLLDFGENLPLLILPNNKWTVFYK